jgi:HK97 family phage portal protein
LKRERRATLRDPDGWLVDALVGGRSTVSGERISANTALTLSGYYAGVRAISEDIGKLPLWLKRHRKGRGSDRMRGHPVNRLIHDAPNPEMSAMAWRETTVAHAINWGKGISEIDRDRGTGMPLAVWPLDPSTVTVSRMTDNGELVFEVRGGSRPDRTLKDDDVFHLHGLGYDGVTGYPLATLARESLGHGMALEKSGSALFANSSRPSGVLEIPQTLSKEKKDELRDQWNAVHGGAENAHKVAVLEQGLQFKAMSIVNKDAQWIEARHFTIEEFARWLRIPPHKIQHLLHATYTNIESQAREYVVDTLMPWMVRFEQEVWRKLLMPREQETMYAEHLVAGLLRAETEARYNAYATARSWGWMSANDVLEKENENPIGEQGDIYLIAANYVPANTLLESPGPVIEAPNDEEPDGEDPEGDEEKERALALLVAEEVHGRLRAEAPGGVDSVNGSRVLTAITEAYEPMLSDAYARLLKQEHTRAVKAHEKTELALWAGEFYDTRAPHVREILRPRVDTLCRAVWGVMRAEPIPVEISRAVADHVAGTAERHVRQSVEDLNRTASPDCLAGEVARGRCSLAVSMELKSLRSLMARFVGVKEVRDDG